MKEVEMSGPVLLNVDDHEPGRYARTRLLQQDGYTVLEAGSGSLALELTERHRPHLILLDVNIPDIDGLEVCRRIKSNPELGHTPVLQISASAITPPHWANALDNGADSYLVEPVAPLVLLATVRALLRMRTAEEERRRAHDALQDVNLALETANESLRRSNEDLQRFSYLASHDLQEPLRTITSFSTLLHRRYKDKLDPDAETLILRIQDGARRMGGLIRDLLAYAQAGVGDAVMEHDIDLSAVVDLARNNLDQALRESGAHLQYSDLPWVKGNETQMVQLFQNLIGNALKYSQPDIPPQINITARPQGAAQWLLSVADNGIGIDPAEADRVFTPFERLHRKEVPGTGLGLATCRRIVEAHGGRIWVSSPGVGMGSTFFFILAASTAALVTPQPPL